MLCIYGAAGSQTHSIPVLFVMLRHCVAWMFPPSSTSSSSSSTNTSPNKPSHSLRLCCFLSSWSHLCFLSTFSTRCLVACCRHHHFTFCHCWVFLFTSSFTSVTITHHTSHIHVVFPSHDITKAYQNQTQCSQTIESSPMLFFLSSYRSFSLF